MAMSSPVKPLMLSSFPRAILHVDGDAFFTSVEQSLHPHLRGRPVVTGRERGIIACASYEAKALGIKRGVSLWDAQKQCPELVILPSDYETYSLVSERMFNIMRRFTPDVEAYSIDEGFADITGTRNLWRCSYPQIARNIQQAIEAELGLTVSIGLSLTKSIAKIASDFRKPNGLCAVAGKHLHLFLTRVPLEDVWGLGRNRVQLLHKYGLATAWDYINQPEPWIRKMLHKPGVEIWHELRGNAVMPLATTSTQPPASISKCKTFTAVSNDQAYVYAKLMRNVESAFIKLRRHKLCSSEIGISLRTRDYRQTGQIVRLNRPITTAIEAAPVIKACFSQIYISNQDYRATQVWLTRLQDDQSRQLDLFENTIRIESCHRIGKATDVINARFGKHTLFVATGLALQRNAPAPGDRDTPCWRKTNLLPGETARQRIRIPRLNIAV